MSDPSKIIEKRTIMVLTKGYVTSLNMIRAPVSVAKEPWDIPKEAIHDRAA